MYRIASVLVLMTTSGPEAGSRAPLARSTSLQTTAFDPERSDGSPVTSRSIDEMRTFAWRNCLGPAAQGILSRPAQDQEGADGGRVG